MQVDVDEKILQWIKLQCQDSIISEKNMDLLEAWIAGDKIPTFNQIETVSKATGIPFGYFFLKEPPEEDLSILEYRTRDSVEIDTPSRNLIDTINDMELIQEWVKEDMLLKGIEPPVFIGAKNERCSIKDFSEYVRHILGINEEWYLGGKSSNDSFKFIRNAISDVGVTVMMSGIVGNNTHRPLSIEEFRAFVLIDSIAPLIFINNNDSYNGKLFSLLHEFNHIILGENSFYNDRNSSHWNVSRKETLCNAVAAEIIVPKSHFMRKWAEKNNEDVEKKVESIARYFRCGTIVVARRALDAKLIKQYQYEKIVENAINNYNIQQKKQKGRDGGNYYNTAASRIDRRFLNSLIYSLKLGNTLYSDAYRLTNTNQSTFEKLVLQMGGGSI